MRCHSVGFSYGNPIRPAVSYAKFCSRSDDAVNRVYDAAGNVIETHEHKGDFREVLNDRDFSCMTRFPCD